MCGIVGCTGPGAQTDDAASILGSMTRRLAHRGPDDEGAWLDREAGVALGHRRLSILDLSPLGHQPMSCACGRYVLTFNGEIYNFRSLRERLEAAGAGFRSQCDTEVLVEAFCRWGIDKALDEAEGMFALASYDRRERRLHLARDRAGIKPLYYGWAGSSFLFASELKAFAAHPEFRPRLNRDALGLYFRLGYVPPPLSIYEGIGKLPPGTVATLDADAPAGSAPRQHEFWSLAAVALEGSRRPLALDDDAAADALEALLRAAVRDQRIADVPVGAFLSGGIDSSLVVALMQSVSPDPVRTFSIGFHDDAYDEAVHAAAIAKHLGTDHRSFYVSPDEMLAVVPQLATLYDEPFAEPSQLPAFLLAQAAREHVKVVITGDGGDELFGGYSWYGRLRDMWAVNRRMPAFARRPLAGGMRRLAHSGSVRQAVGGVWPRAGRALTAQHHRLTAMLDAPRLQDLYLELRTEWPDAASLVRDANGAHGTVLDGDAPLPDLPDVRLQGMYLDSLTFLPEHPLTKADRATMAVGLEARVPLLARDVVEFAWRLPVHQRIRGSTTKYLLRRVLERHVPPELFERPKAGFPVPIGEWLRGPLREWAEPLLAPDRLRGEGLLDAGMVHDVWQQHQSGSHDWGRQLWSVAVFEAWLETQQLTPSRQP